MIDSEWARIADRLEGAWPPFPATRRELYLEVLKDVDASVVGSAVEELVREDRAELPPPGTIRQRALSLAARAPVAGPAPSRDPLAALMAGEAAATGELEARAYGVDGPPTEPPPGLAVASLVCGIVGLLLIPFICGVLAIVFGVVATNQINARPGRGGGGMAGWGVALGVVSIIVWTAIFLTAGSGGSFHFEVG